MLRISIGDSITVVDGMGGWFRCEVTSTDSDRMRCTIVESRNGVGEPAYSLSVAVGLPKNRGRLEFLIEKLVELGASKIIPLETERTQDRKLNTTRCEGIIVAATKQSGRSVLAALGESQSFSDYVAEESSKLKIMLHEKALPEQSISSIVNNLKTGASTIALAIGPEGGFSDGEVATAQDAGWQLGFLGERRLRTETATIAAAAVVAASYLNID